MDQFASLFPDLRLGSFFFAATVLTMTSDIGSEQRQVDFHRIRKDTFQFLSVYFASI